MPDQCATTTLTQTITMAEGVFAPGHLGALTRFVPFELVDSVLDHPSRRERIRSAPLRVGVYFVLALALFPERSYRQVWDSLTGAIRQMGATVARMTDSGLTDLRQRLGPDPLRETFDVVAGPLGRPTTPGVAYRGLRTVAFDGCRSTRVPQTRDNLAWLGLHKLAAGTVASYPLLMVMALVETGTRALLGAVLSPIRGEVEAALELIGHLSGGMLVLADRGFDANAFLCAIHRTGAGVLLRVCSPRTPPVLQVLHDGSHLSVIAGIGVRIIDAEVSLTLADGTLHHARYRLVTTLTCARRYPAAELLALYHQRWEIEIAFLALRSTMLHGRVLRSSTPQGLRQEMWALLTAYQLLRTAMLDATDAIGGCDPDRAGFTAALTASRDTITRACAVLPTPGQELTSPITEAVAASLLPARRPRISARTVKGVSARYGHRAADEDRPPVSTTVTAIDITVVAPEQTARVPAAATGTAPGEQHPSNQARLSAACSATPAPARRPLHPDRLLPPPTPSHTSRLEDLQALMSTDPHRTWTVTELATLLRLDYKSLSASLHQWARRGIFVKARRGAFTIPQGPPVPSKLAVRLPDVLAIMSTDPQREWRPRDIAAALNTVKESTLAMHMSAWARENLLAKTAPATYVLPSALVVSIAVPAKQDERSQNRHAA
ncbi:IS4 family transposase [Acrocarpospora sp. B8E8]|uniref:IS4 family transposase n=1 Tax=Acrocarpospora sp. B8E8 TaxID=3153572 RepID=UPI00325D4014